MPEPDDGKPDQTQTKKSICALTLVLLPDGQGLHLNPVTPDAGWTERLPTLCDMRAMVHELDQHLQAQMHLALIAQIQQQQRDAGVIAGIKRRLIR